MAKKSKIESEKQPDSPAPGAAGSSPKPAARPAKKARAAEAKPKQKKAAPKEKTAKVPPPRRANKPASEPASAEPSDDAIRLRAYFLAERRARLSLPGDSAHDWIEARRQLLEEVGR